MGELGGQVGRNLAEPCGHVEPEAGQQSVDHIDIGLVDFRPCKRPQRRLGLAEVIVDEAVHGVERHTGIVLGLIVGSGLGHNRHGESHHILGQRIELGDARRIKLVHRREVHIGQCPVQPRQAEILLHALRGSLLGIGGQDAVGIVDESVVEIKRIGRPAGEIGGLLQRALIVIVGVRGREAVEQHLAPQHIARVTPV